MSQARAIFLALLLCWTCVAAAEVAVPPLTGRVVDLTGTLSSADIAALSQRLKDLEARKGSQVAVLIVPTTQPETIEQFSIRVADAWKIGRRKIDDGALLVVAKNDRKLRIEVGYGLEGGLTDLTARRIIDEVITPKFRTGDFAGGISAGLTRIIGAIEGEPLPAPAPEASNGEDLDWLFYFINPVFLLVYLAVGGVLRLLLGGVAGSIVTGALVGAFAWYLLGSVGAAVLLGIAVFLFTLMAGAFAVGQGVTRRSGRGAVWTTGWPGGGGGGWSGGSRSIDSDGGFSGGGGSFGGGGASGSW
jgi:uncharacterized protein